MAKIKIVIGTLIILLIVGISFSFAQTAEDAKAKAKAHIDAMDTNKDGQISKDEFMATCKGANCAQRFDALDANKDGFLTKEEAQKAVEGAKEKAATIKEKARSRGQSVQ